jgi:hypothetical protein
MNILVAFTDVGIITLIQLPKKPLIFSDKVGEYQRYGCYRRQAIHRSWSSMDDYSLLPGKILEFPACTCACSSYGLKMPSMKMLIDTNLYTPSAENPLENMLAPSARGTWYASHTIGMPLNISSVSVY